MGWGDKGTTDITLSIEQCKPKSAPRSDSILEWDTGDQKYLKNNTSIAVHNIRGNQATRSDNEIFVLLARKQLHSDKSNSSYSHTVTRHRYSIVDEANYKSWLKNMEVGSTGRSVQMFTYKNIKVVK